MSQSGPSEPGARAHGQPTDAHRCSCEFLIELCSREPARSIVADAGVPVDRLAQAQWVLHARAVSEPADWRLRLRFRQRAPAHGVAGELEALLALVRTAESHAYQLLERAGINCTQLRRVLIVRVREFGPTTAAREASEPAAEGPGGADEPAAQPARLKVVRARDDEERRGRLPEGVVDAPLGGEPLARGAGEAVADLEEVDTPSRPSRR